MAIPTQFSVTKKAKCPIANPDISQDLANSITAESIGFISGASNLPSKSPSQTDSAVVIDSEAAPTQDDASLVSALNPSNLVNPSLVSSKSVPTQDDASALPVIPQVEIGGASAATTQGAPSLSVPSTISSNTGTDIAPNFPLNHARILHTNKLLGYESVSSIKGVPVNALTPNTWQRWIFDSTASSSGIRIDLPVAVDMDTICICAHNLGAIGGVVSLSYSTDGTTFVDWEPDFPVETNAAIMSHLTTTKSVKSIQIFIQSGASAVGFIGYISAGVALQMQRPFFNGHQPYIDSDVTEYYSNRTESGNIIGRQIRRKGFETTFEWNNLSDEWYRTYIPVFKERAKREPMVIAWNLLEYPKDVAFGETTGDFATSMQNGTMIKRSSLSFTLKGV